MNYTRVMTLQSSITVSLHMQKLVALLSEGDVISCYIFTLINILSAAIPVSGRNVVGAENHYKMKVISSLYVHHKFDK